MASIGSCDLSTWLISGLSIEFMNYILVCGLSPGKFFHVSKALGCVSFLCALLILSSYISVSLGLVLCLVSLFSFLESKTLRDIKREITHDEGHFLALLHSALQVPFILFMSLNIMIYQRE